jgi:hypothetical protein
MNGSDGQVGIEHVVLDDEEEEEEVNVNGSRCRTSPRTDATLSGGGGGSISVWIRITVLIHKSFRFSPTITLPLRDIYECECEYS